MTAPADLKQQLKLKYDIFMDCYNKGDPDAILNLYIDECRVMPPKRPIITSKKELRELYRVYMEDAGLKSSVVENEEIIVKDDHVIDRGSYAACLEDGSEYDYGKSVIIWVKQDGDWFIKLHIWNSDRQ